MNSRHTIALITGGAGGIGKAIAAQLLTQGASVLLVGRNRAALQAVAVSLSAHAERVSYYAADLTNSTERSALCRHAQTWRGGINTLINNAGTHYFKPFEQHSAGEIGSTLSINIEAPMQLCLQLLPHLRKLPAASILNIGSVFGGIGYPGYVAYSATKFALRGFSEALRRELAHTNIKVAYCAPRATRTAFNSDAVEHMNAALGVAMDSPESVARAVCALLNGKRTEVVLGWPEKLFVRINAVLPAVVDKAIRKQLPLIQQYAEDRHPPPAALTENSSTVSS